jgi:uncharacterized protein YxeA
MDFLKKNAKVILIVIGVILLSVLLYKTGKYIYDNSNAYEKYEYTSKAIKDQMFDQNVKIEKAFKHNGSQGEIKMAFDKKDLDEVYSIALSKGLNPTHAEVSVEGAVNYGEVNIRLIDQSSKVVFERSVKGPSIKEVSTSDVNSNTYKLLITSNGAKNGKLTIKYRLF